MIFIQGILSSCFCLRNLKEIIFGHKTTLLDLFGFYLGFLLDVKTKR